MVTIVFALAVANLGLGFALAVAMDRFPVLPIPQFRRRSKGKRSEVVPGESESSLADSASSAAVDDWSRKLKEAEVDPRSAIERLLWIVKLATSAGRKKLIELDRVFFDPHAPKAILGELKSELESLYEQLDAWIAVAGGEREQGGALAEAVEELLLDQTFQLRSCADGLTEGGRDTVAPQLAAAMKAVNVLRDRVDVLLCDLLTAEDRVQSVADCYRTFGERDTLTHLGLAGLFDQWWADDPEHVRLVSLVMLDLDRFESFTQKIGAAHGDIALLRFGDLLHDLLRKDRGFDRVARFSGQRFLMFLGDTSSKNAAKGAERIRQTIEATSFKLGEETSEVTASLAVIDVGNSESPRDFIPRLEATLAECKKAGRNCGFVDSGDGPGPIKLPQYQVSVRVIELDEDVAERPESL